MSRTGRLMIAANTVAGLCYASFPLALLVNRPDAWRGLVSELGELGQPYAAFFNISDVVSAVLSSLVFIVLLAQRRQLSRWGNWALIAGLLANVGTLAAAVIPLPDDFSTTNGLVITNLIHQPLVIAHGFFSLVNSGCFVISAALWAYAYSSSWNNWRRLLALVLVIISTIGAITGIIYPVTAGGIQRVFIVGYAIWLVGLTVDTLRCSKRLARRK